MFNNLEKENSNLLQRYMSISKFKKLVETSSLYCSKMSKFTDSLEGGLSLSGYLEKTNSLAIFDQALNGCWPSLEKKKNPESNSIENLSERKFQTPFGSYSKDLMEEIFPKCRDWLYVSCWHASPHECYAMWKIYGGEKDAICIVTNKEKLKSQLNLVDPNITVDFREIEYLDHDTAIPSSNPMQPFSSKSLSFSFEKEYRIIAYNPNIDLQKLDSKPTDGINIEIKSMNDLIDAIILGPDSESTLKQSIEEICKFYQIRAPIIQSVLDKKPISNMYDALAIYQHNQDR